MADVNSIDPRSLSIAEFTRLLGPATSNDIGTMEPQSFARLIKHASAEQLDAVSGNSNPAMMLVTGKVKLDGDIGFAAQLTKIFDMPTQ